MHTLLSSRILFRFLTDRASFRQQREELEADRQQLIGLHSIEYDDPKVQHTSDASKQEIYVQKILPREEALREAHRSLRSVQKATKLLIYGVTDKIARKALICRCMRGMSWEECAAELDTTPGAIRQRVYRNALPEVNEEITGMMELLKGVIENGKS